MSTSNTEVPAVLDAKARTTALLNSFLDKPLARSQQSIEERILHWQSVANYPDQHLKDDKSPAAERQKRRTAIQALRRLVTKYPAIAQKLQREVSA